MNDVLKQFENAIRISQWDGEAERLLKRPRGVIACDTETTGLLFHSPSYLKDERRWVDNPFPFGISLAFLHGQDAVLVWGRVGTALYTECKRILASVNTKLWHNLKYDHRVCKTNDIGINGPQHCTLTMSRIVNDRRKSHGLQELGEVYLTEVSDWEDDLDREKTRLQTKWTNRVKKENIWLPEGLEAKDYFNYSFLPDDLIGKYSQNDGFNTLHLYKMMWPIIQENYRELYLRERKVIYVVIKIEEVGMRFDAERGRREIQKLTPKIREAEQTCVDFSERFYRPVRTAASERYAEIKADGVLKDYPQQDELKKLRKEMKLQWAFGPDKILDMLLRLGVKRKQLKVGQKMTTGEDVLRRTLAEGVPHSADKFIRSLLDYRARHKIVSTYLGPLTRQAERTGGFIYTNINPSDTRTSRPASKSPNLLNIPRPTTGDDGNNVRACFIPREGCAIYYFDVKQQEMAQLFVEAIRRGLHQAQELLDAYLNGEDIHQHMADVLGRPDERDAIKGCNFAVVYGQGHKAMSLVQGISVEQAKENMKVYDDCFPFVQELVDMLRWDLKNQRYVEDLFGGRYHIPWQQAFKGVNAICQGGCAKAFKDGLLAIDRYYEEEVPDAHILLPVYDEAQCERPVDGYEREFCVKTKECIWNILQLLDLGLKLQVDVKRTTSSWADKKEIEL